MRYFLIALTLVLCAPPTLAQDHARAPAAGLRSSALEAIERQITQLFSDVSHISPEQLAALLTEKPGQIVLLDVREPDEVATSRIEGAVAIPPLTRRASEVIAATGDLKDKIVVAYCSIGLRSSRLIARIGQTLKERGAVELHNLRGGIFLWHNERRTLVDASGPTSAIHPHNILWRQFLIDAPQMADATP